VAREQHGGFNPDSWVYQAGCAASAGEVAHELRKIQGAKGPSRRCGRGSAARKFSSHVCSTISKDSLLRTGRSARRKVQPSHCQLVVVSSEHLLLRRLVIAPGPDRER
jgi:hypothetical protein